MFRIVLNTRSYSQCVCYTYFLICMLLFCVTRIFLGKYQGGTTAEGSVVDNFSDSVAWKSAIVESITVSYHQQVCVYMYVCICVPPYVLLITHALLLFLYRLKRCWIPHSRWIRHYSDDPRWAKKLHQQMIPLVCMSSLT